MSSPMRAYGSFVCKCGGPAFCYPDDDQSGPNGIHTYECDNCGRTWVTTWQTKEQVPPPTRMKRWCVRDTRNCEPYEGWQIWEAEMEKVPGKDIWEIIPRQRYGGRFGWSFETRGEAYAEVLECLREELAEKQRELEAMQLEAGVTE